MSYPLLAAIDSDIDAQLDPVDSKPCLLGQIAGLLAERIVKRQGVSRRVLTRLMTELFGAGDASGAWSMRDAYDALEVAQVLAMLRQDTDPVGNAYAMLASIEAECRALPTQSYRSERQVDLQQFSTPMPLAWLAARAAAMQTSDLVLEPSAGTSMLAVHARVAGARLMLNERDPHRAALLERALGEPVTSHDAEFIDDLLGTEIQPSVVLINPPFSRSEGRGRDRHAGARHLRSALARLSHGGRCIAIMPPAFAHDGTAASSYDAVASLVPPRTEITITGQPYVKHGTA
ncbi:hypothetical protein [Sphingomonas tagetis]|uniref:hypothetical protein n=1 Tax=Sphingomonas tagetis TaxID=2949092 RepID=UPI00345EF95A